MSSDIKYPYDLRWDNNIYSPNNPQHNILSGGTYRAILVDDVSLVTVDKESIKKHGITLPSVGVHWTGFLPEGSELNLRVQCLSSPNLKHPQQKAYKFLLDEQGHWKSFEEMNA